MKTAKTQLDREVDKKRQQKATIEGQLKAVENAIDKIRNTDTDAIADAAQKMKAKIEEKVANIEAIDAKIQTTRNHAKNLEHNLFSIRNEERDLRATINESKQENVTVTREIKKLKADGGDNRKYLDCYWFQYQLIPKWFWIIFLGLIMFGEKMPNLVAEIKKNANKFGQMPIGPIGLEIKLKKDITKQEATLIEIELGDVLKSFIVDNFADRTLLNRLMQKCGIHTGVTTVSSLKSFPLTYIDMIFALFHVDQIYQRIAQHRTR